MYISKKVAENNYY